MDGSVGFPVAGAGQGGETGHGGAPGLQQVGHWCPGADQGGQGRIWAVQGDQDRLWGGQGE